MLTFAADAAIARQTGPLFYPSKKATSPLHILLLLMLQEHNSRADKSHTLALNKFADWHRDEFLATVLPNYGKPRPSLPLEGKQMVMHKPKVPEHMLPSTVDWRGTGADSPVKDQASCGSCWVSQHK